MRVDSHVHLQPHGERPPVDRERLDAYVAAARRNGVDVLAITEHLFRFREAYDLLYGWWNRDPDPALAATVQRYWQDHVNLSLPEYVRLIESAKSEGAPLLLGMEMDWIPGRAEDLRRLLAPYDWDIVLGSVHWVGAFGFDIEESLPEWERRDVDAVFAEYAGLIDELADSGLADVLAHPDLPKVFGHYPSNPDGFHASLVAAAVRGGCAIEINTNGLNKAGGIYPAASLLCDAQKAGLAVTLGSDAHTPDRVGNRFDVALLHARRAGYAISSSFKQRRRLDHPL